MVIDRFEGNFAVIELGKGNFENMPRLQLPTNAKEGDCIIISIDRNIIDTNKERINNKMNKLFLD